MQETQMKFQRIVVVGCLVLASVMVLYALGFSTDLYPLIYHVDSTSTLFYVPGAELYKEVQPFNRALFTHVLLYFVVCITLFLSLTHRRRLYYISNYVTSAAFAVFSVFLGAEVFTNVRWIKDKYLAIDFVRLREVTENMKMAYTESTMMMDIGMWISMLLFVAAIAVCVNLVLKAQWMRREKWSDEFDVGAAAAANKN